MMPVFRLLILVFVLTFVGCDTGTVQPEDQASSQAEEAEDLEKERYYEAVETFQQKMLEVDPGQNVVVEVQPSVVGAIEVTLSNQIYDQPKEAQLGVMKNIEDAWKSLWDLGAVVFYDEFGQRIDR